MEKIITGYWDGQEIWREKTAAEKLAHELAKNRSKRLLDHDCHASPDDSCEVCYQEALKNNEL